MSIIRHDCSMMRVIVFSMDDFCVNINSCAIPITKPIVIPFFSLEEYLFLIVKNNYSARLIIPVNNEVTNYASNE
jgi:hypothetical protein